MDHINKTVELKDKHIDTLKNVCTQKAEAYEQMYYSERGALIRLRYYKTDPNYYHDRLNYLKGKYDIWKEIIDALNK